jgi:hypothetical protein
MQVLQELKLLTPPATLTAAAAPATRALCKPQQHPFVRAARHVLWLATNMECCIHSVAEC